MPGSAVMGTILFGLGIFVCYHGIDLTVGKPSLPGPGFVPLGLGSILMLLSSVYLYQSFGKKEKRKDPSTRSGYYRLLMAAGVMALYAWIVSWVGYILTTFLFFVVWVYLIERKNWVQTVSLACLAVVAVYFFNTLFSVQLPTGLLKGIVR
jgi:putative tricarboxylic transport membrane protein